MIIHDISVPISPTLAVFPGDPDIRIERIQDLARGDTLNLSLLQMSSHTGTHVDAPLHFVSNGPAIHELDLHILVGPAQVVDFTRAESVIRLADLERATIPPIIERILFKTRNSEMWSQLGFQRGFVGLDVEAADWLIRRGTRLVGIDYLSVEPFGLEPNVHRMLCSAGVIILEGLDLRQVPAGSHTLVCLPLKLQGAEGAPARVILLESGPEA